MTLCNYTTFSGLLKAEYGLSISPFLFFGFLVCLCLPLFLHPLPTLSNSMSPSFCRSSSISLVGIHWTFSSLQLWTVALADNPMWHCNRCWDHQGCFDSGEVVGRLMYRWLNDWLTHQTLGMLGLRCFRCFWRLASKKKVLLVTWICQVLNAVEWMLFIHQFKYSYMKFKKLRALRNISFVDVHH